MSSEKKLIPIIFEDSSDEEQEEIKSIDNESVILHEKRKFISNTNESLYDTLKNQEQFQYINLFKRSVNRIDIRGDNVEKITHPLLSNMRDKIENEYGMRVLGIFLNYYKDDDYAPYHRDTYGDGKGVFTVSLGGTRMFYTKNDDTKVVTKYKLEDGDLFYFNSQFNAKHKHSVPKLKSYKDPRISVVFFV